MSSQENVPKKRGRKAKVPVDKESTPTVPKKRGRKPKGGKIVENIKINNDEKEIKSNVILHLKCNSTDIQSNDIQNSDVVSFNFDNPKNNDLSYEIIQKNVENHSKSYLGNESECCDTNSSLNFNSNTDDEKNNDSDVNKIKEDYKEEKRLFQKLKELQINLHHNNISDKKSACFWCTCDFDNPPIYIPKNEINGNYNVYGCFCSPECATAYLMNENINTSIKFERYYILNHIYAKIYEYEKNIKPAPNPYYTLDKFYGNLNIQEYRKLLNNDRLLFIVDKPMTRILPELHDDNEDYMLNKKTSSNFKVRRNKQNSKTNILNENFGLISNN